MAEFGCCMLFKVTSLGILLEFSIQWTRGSFL